MRLLIYHTIYLTLPLLFVSTALYAQIDHYETMVYADDIWSYRVADSEAPSGWMQPGFDDTAWPQGQGGFGYGDGDDNTIIPQSNGVYMRLSFDVIDINAIETLILDADYDDAFVAYLNGVEVARSNIGQVGIPPAFDDQPDSYHEAVLYDGGTPERYVLDDNLGTLQQGSNVLAIHIVNYSANSSDLTGRMYLSVGVNHPNQVYGTIPFWFDVPFDFTTSNLPILMVNTGGQTIVDEPEITAQLGIIHNGPGNMNSTTDPFNEYDGQITIEIRGASSQSFPKKQYRIETQTDMGENNNVSLFGMPAENDWVLNGPYSDKTLIRNVLSYQLGAWTGRYTPRYQLCELVINGEYRGVYVWLEKIKRDNDRVDMAKVTPMDIEGDELTGGYLMQIDRDNEFINEGWYSDAGDYPYFYALEDPEYDEILPVQRAYIEDYINEFEAVMTGPNMVSEYEDYLNVGSFVDYFLVNEIGKHVDAFKLSFYMHKKKDSNGGKLHIGPIWDFNLAYGNFDFACDPSPYDWIYPCTSPVTWLDNTLTIPAVQDSVYCRWTYLRETVWSTDNIMGFIDSVVLDLEDAKNRNFQYWDDVIGNYIWPNDYVGQSYEDEVNFMKNFLQVRLDWMDENMFGQGAVCSVSTSTEDVSDEWDITLFPNPMQDYLQVKNNSELDGVLIRIYTLDGKLMHKQALPNTDIAEIKIQEWPSGSYLYNISKDISIVQAGVLVKE